MSTQELTGLDVTGDEAIWVEEREEQNRFVVRLDLPGIEPDEDLDVSIDEHVLTICAIGPAAFRVCLPLPARTNDRDAAATYRDGALEVSVGWQQGPTARKIKVLSLASVR